MHFKSFSLMSCLLAISCLGACTQASNQTDLVINNVTVVDAVSPMRVERSVVIRDDKIFAVNPTLTGSAATAPNVVDGSGQFLIPGLWDMHVHFLYEPKLTEQMADLFLQYGVTSVRDTGGNLADLAALRERLTERSRPSPRIYFSGPLLDGKFVVYDGSDPARPALGVDVANTSSANARVKELKDAGADLIKIYELVQPDVYADLVAAARSQDLPIASHVPLMLTADEAGPLADSMEHLRNIELACASNWQELLQQRRKTIREFSEGLGYELRRGLHSAQRLPAIAAYDENRCNEVLDTLQNTTQVPTLRLNTVFRQQPWTRNDWPAALSGMPDDVAQQWQSQIDLLKHNNTAPDHRFADWSLFLISRLLERKVPIAAGTDTPIGLGIPGYSLHTELELLVAGGMTPTQALYAATVAPTHFFNNTDQIGQIKPGMTADLILLNANPLDDISNTRNIAAVMTGGTWIRR
jgi:imidazolonepropionase-like amidohydrolase